MQSAARRRTAGLVAAVAIVAAAALAGGADHSQAATTQPAPVAAHVQAPAQGAQPGAIIRHRSQFVPFYWQGFRNWNGQWCAGLFSDSGQLVYFYCY